MNSKNPFEYPYDLYQRYKLAVQVIEHLDQKFGKSAPILEVGGDPGVLQSFLPDEAPTIVNSQPFRGNEVIRADGCHLPFRDKSFRGVIALDVLEHIPNKKRPTFLHEIDQVTSDWLIIGGPFEDKLVQDAEAIISDYYKHLTGLVHPYLEEHRQQGLPKLQTVLDYLHSLGGHTMVIPNGLIGRWMLVMGITMFLQKEPSDAELIGRVNNFVNRNLAPFDNLEPAYRHIIVCSKIPLQDDIGIVVSTSDSKQHIDREWEGATAALQTMITEKIRLRDERISQLEGQIRILQEFQDQVQASLPYRIYRQWKKLWKNR
jgi:hypothetical protein